jgi:hypothetical protein
MTKLYLGNGTHDLPPSTLMLMLIAAPPASENHELIEGMHDGKAINDMIEQSAQRAGKNQNHTGIRYRHEG